ncbi:MAG: hypothetical protein DRJ03_24895 [Chloroflexi bacterium]|nr:MAG: hypothetical protein DRJ03_24860 [Chloroflexota bacterium]RLC78679.1 MAG: hypothetical protein DRJ03_24895 [Chloroflexota bacterium]
MNEHSFLIWLTYYSQSHAYNIYYNVYINSLISIEEECLEDFYFNTFITILRNNLERHGFSVKSVKEIEDEYGEYIVVELENYKITIRETISCGEMEFFEFLVEKS